MLDLFCDIETLVIEESRLFYSPPKRPLPVSMVHIRALVFHSTYYPEDAEALIRIVQLSNLRSLCLHGIDIYPKFQSCIDTATGLKELELTFLFREFLLSYP